jgi:hypothetical protein
LERQRELGAGIDPEHWPYIKLVVALLLLGQVRIEPTHSHSTTHLGEEMDRLQWVLKTVGGGNRPQAACFFLARLILRKLTRQKLRKFFLCVGLVIMVTGLLVVFQTAFIYEDVEHYRGQLPFNYIDPNPIDRCAAVFSTTPNSFSVRLCFCPD